MLIASAQLIIYANGMIMERLFLSGDPRDSERYRLAFATSFGHLFAPQRVGPGIPDAGSASEYIDALRRLGVIDAASIVVVLVSRMAHASRRVDWEIAAGLEPEPPDAAGLLGIMLPEVPRRIAHEGTGLAVPFFDYGDMPPRLADNVKSGYARIYDWNWLCADEARVAEAARVAAAWRRERAHLIDNSRVCLTADLPLTPEFSGNRERRRRV